MNGNKNRILIYFKIFIIIYILQNFKLNDKNYIILGIYIFLLLKTYQKAAM